MSSPEEFTDDGEREPFVNRALNNIPLPKLCPYCGSKRIIQNFDITYPWEHRLGEKNFQCNNKNCMKQFSVFLHPLTKEERKLWKEGLWK